ncbi:MAG: general secretion pathway protein GspB, partial [Gammaproteobacteria bacterium]
APTSTPASTQAPAAPAPSPARVEPVTALPREVPRWQDLPADQRAALPTPRIDVHVFARDPERRFVLIDLRKHHEGDRLDDGTTLEAIRTDGIELSYRGQHYRVDRP